MKTKSKGKDHEETVRDRICRVLYGDIDERRYFFKRKRVLDPEGEYIQTDYYDWRGKKRKEEFTPAKGGPPEQAWVFDRKKRLCFFETGERPGQPGTYDIEIRIITDRECTITKKTVFIRTGGNS